MRRHAAWLLLLPLAIAGCSADGPDEGDPDAAAIAAVTRHLSDSDADAVAGRESRAAHEEDLERAAASAVVCEQETAGLVSALQEIDSRLAIGMNLISYSELVGSARVEYDTYFNTRSDDDPLGSMACLTGVGVPLEVALNKYAEVHGTWSECIQDYGCDTDDPDVQTAMQTGWVAAGQSIDTAISGYDTLDTATLAEVEGARSAPCAAALDAPDNPSAGQTYRADWDSYASGIVDSATSDAAAELFAPLAVTAWEIAIADGSEDDLAELRATFDDELAWIDFQCSSDSAP